MKSYISLSKLLIAIFTVVISTVMLSCEKEFVEKDDDTNPNGTTTSDTRPVLLNGTISATSIENNSETKGFENPFEAVSLHNPEELALVNCGEPSEKKSALVDPGQIIFNLYEISSEKFDMVQGKEGNDIYFTGITLVKRINDTWQLFAGDGEGVKLFTKELTVNYEYEIRIDSIYNSDTIPMADASNEPYKSIGDTLFISADTTIFNDTLWIQSSYIYTDTIDTQTDTIEVERSVLFKALLLNTKSGDLYELDSEVLLFTQGSKNLDPFQYRENENALYFRNQTGNQICKLDLTALSLETFTMPYGIDGPWSEVDGNFFFYNYSQYPKAFCYVPGTGLITKSNIGPDPDIGSCWTGDMNTYIWIRGVQGALNTPQGLFENPGIYTMFTLEIRNDSMIFSPIEMHTGLEPVNPTDLPELDLFTSSIGDNVDFEICAAGDRWFFYNTDGVAWKFNEETSFIDIFAYGGDREILNNRISNGKNIHISLFNNTIYKLDMSVPSLEEFFPITELDISGFNVGHKHNIFVSGMRFSDLNDAIVEYDGETGAKIAEWIEENAPPESSISFLSPIF